MHVVIEMYELRIKRIYDEYEESDGMRILVDALWPRGISKERAHLDLWDKAISPTTSLRKAFNHEVDKYEDFQKQYRQELIENPHTQDFLKMVFDHLEKQPVTLLYGAKDTKHNQAVVLKEFILEEMKCL